MMAVKRILRKESASLKDYSTEFLRRRLNRGVHPQTCPQLWTEFLAHRGDALITNGKEPQNPNKLVVAATFEMGKT